MGGIDLEYVGTIEGDFLLAMDGEYEGVGSEQLLEQPGSLNDEQVDEEPHQ